MPRQTDLQALLGRLGNVTGRDLFRAAEERGWELDRIRGSHHIYRRDGRHLSIPLKPSRVVARAIIEALMENEMADESTIRSLVSRPYTRTFVPEDDGTITARVLEFPGCISGGDSPAEAWENINEALAGIIDSMLDHGDPIPEPINGPREYSGRLQLRMPPSLHRKVTERAAMDGVSINRWLSDAVAQAAGESPAGAAAAPRGGRPGVRPGP